MTKIATTIWEHINKQKNQIKKLERQLFENIQFTVTGLQWKLYNIEIVLQPKKGGQFYNFWMILLKIWFTINYAIKCLPGWWNNILLLQHIFEIFMYWNFTTLLCSL